VRYANQSEQSVVEWIRRDKSVVYNLSQTSESHEDIEDKYYNNCLILPRIGIYLKKLMTREVVVTTSTSISIHLDQTEFFCFVASLSLCSSFDRVSLCHEDPRCFLLFQPIPIQDAYHRGVFYLNPALH